MLLWNLWFHKSFAYVDLDRLVYVGALGLLHPFHLIFHKVSWALRGGIQLETSLLGLTLCIMQALEYLHFFLSAIGGNFSIMAEQGSNLRVYQKVISNHFITTLFLSICLFFFFLFVWLLFFVPAVIWFYLANRVWFQIGPWAT